jgi:hypothetical protein
MVSPKLLVAVVKELTADPASLRVLASELRGCLQNGCTRRYGVEFGFKMLIYAM